MTAPILARLDAWDVEHSTTGCPGGPECIHTAVLALRAVLALHIADGYGDCCECADLSDGPGEASPRPMPCLTVERIAEALAGATP